LNLTQPEGGDKQLEPATQEDGGHGDDVIDVEGGFLIRLGEPAVFAAVGRTVNNL
jgi:hypothetical protein